VAHLCLHSSIHQVLTKVLMSLLGRAGACVLADKIYLTLVVVTTVLTSVNGLGAVGWLVSLKCAGFNC